MAKMKDCTPIAGDAAYSNPSNANCGPYDLVLKTRQLSSSNMNETVRHTRILVKEFLSMQVIPINELYRFSLSNNNFPHEKPCIYYVRILQGQNKRENYRRTNIN